MNNLRRRIGSSGDKIELDTVTGRGFIDEYEVVDLGLPSNTLWATCNVGANSETAYGNYYQWGAGSKIYNKNKDQYYTGSADDIAGTKYDTAKKVMGGSWHMPTLTQCRELINNTNYSWTKINSRYGGKFSSKTDPNKYIFIPAAGCYRSGSLEYKNRYGYIWNSTSKPSGDPTYSYAYNLFFNDNGAECTDNNVYAGYSIRGVHPPL